MIDNKLWKNIAANWSLEAGGIKSMSVIDKAAEGIEGESIDSAEPIRSDEQIKTLDPTSQSGSLRPSDIIGSVDPTAPFDSLTPVDIIIPGDPTAESGALRPGDIISPGETEQENSQNSSQEDKPIEELQRPRRPRLDNVKFAEFLEQQNLLAYVEACGLLRKCELPEDMDNLYKELIIRIRVLQESLDKFGGVYQPNMNKFYEYYIPEALQLTATYIEYLDVGIKEQILTETEGDVLAAAKKLLIAVNDTIDEVYKFASIEIKAKAKALESIMSQDGHVDTSFKIN